MFQERGKLRYRYRFLAVGAVTAALIFAVFSILSRIGRNAPARNIASSSTSITSLLHSSEEPASCKHLYVAVCRGIGQIERDPTGIVRPDVEGERIVAEMYKNIVSSHPDWNPEQVDDELARQVYTPMHRARIEAAYHWVQSRIVQFIDGQPEQVFNAHEKKLLTDRIKGTALEIPPPASIYSDEPDLLTTNDVFYERTQDGTRRMRVGGAYLFTARSWFNMVFTMGHELGHAIDPCEVRSAGLSFPAYDHLEACFLRTGIVATPKERVECQANDQLSEAFADWLGSQITAEALKPFSAEYHGAQLLDAAANAVRDLCSQGDDDLDTVNHPAPTVRIERIFGAQPGIRSLLGCTSYEKPPLYPSEYCSFSSDIPHTKAPL